MLIVKTSSSLCGCSPWEARDARWRMASDRPQRNADGVIKTALSPLIWLHHRPRLSPSARQSRWHHRTLSIARYFPDFTSTDCRRTITDPCWMWVCVCNPFPISAQHIIRRWTVRQETIYSKQCGPRKHALKNQISYCIPSERRALFLKVWSEGQQAAFITHPSSHKRTENSKQQQEEETEEDMRVFTNQSCAIVQSAKVNSSLSCSNR